MDTSNFIPFQSYNMSSFPISVIQYWETLTNIYILKAYELILNLEWMSK